MNEYDFFDGDHFITFDIVEINDDNETVTVAISNQGRITQDAFNLLEDKKLAEYAKIVILNTAYIWIEFMSMIFNAYKEI